MASKDFKLEKDMPLKDMIKGLEASRAQHERHVEIPTPIPLLPIPLLLNGTYP